MFIVIEKGINSDNLKVLFFSFVYCVLYIYIGIVRDLNRFFVVGINFEGLMYDVNGIKDY